MNHINKDSRPDLLERINVKVEPGGGRTGLNQNVRENDEPLAGFWTLLDEEITIQEVRGHLMRHL